MTEQVAMHALVRGTVQGVGFRAATLRIATKHGVKGTVANLSDGAVEIYAQGSKDSLNAFFQDLQNHFKNYVASIDFESVSAGSYQDFKIES